MPRFAFAPARLPPNALEARIRTREFLKVEIAESRFAPHLNSWSSSDASFSARAGAAGLIGTLMPQAFGEQGLSSQAHYTVAEEILASGVPCVTQSRWNAGDSEKHRCQESSGMPGIVQDLTGRTSDFEAMEQAVLRLFDRGVTPDCLAQAESGQTAVEIWAALEASGLGLEASAVFELLRLTAAYSVPVAIGETMITTALWGQPLDGQVTLISDFDRMPYGRQARFGAMRTGRDEIALIEMPKTMGPDQNLANEPRDAFKSDPAGHKIATLKPALGKTMDVMACGALLRFVHMCGAFTQDHPLNRSTRRLWSWLDEFGKEAIWQQQIGCAIGSEGGGGIWHQVLTAISGAQE